MVCREGLRDSSNGRWYGEDGIAGSSNVAPGGKNVCLFAKGESCDSSNDLRLFIC